MVNLQVLFLFTSLKTFNQEQRNRIQTIVEEEYCKTFSIKSDNLAIKMFDAYSSNSKDDVVIAVDTDTHVMNEAKLRENTRANICSRFSLLQFLKAAGFSGKVGIINGPVDKDDNEREPIRNNNMRNRVDNAVKTDDVDQLKTELGLNYEERAKLYQATDPKYTFDMVQLKTDTIEQIETALARIEYEKEVFDEWGLYAIMPNPTSALSFFGPPGTGKSLAADAIASKMNKKIIRVSYPDIQSKYVGEGPKNIVAIFLAAETQDAILFIDEAESLLSKRLENVNDPSAQSMNSMRSQFLISMEKFHGIVIFASNLAKNYDKAFLSRMINIEFEMPDEEMRQKIWKTHLPLGIGNNSKLKFPTSEDVNVYELSHNFVLCGRDIRNAVINACVEAKRTGQIKVTQELLVKSATGIVNTNQSVINSEDFTAIKSGNEEKNLNMPENLKEKVEEKVKEIVNNTTPISADSLNN